MESAEYKQFDVRTACILGREMRTSSRLAKENSRAGFGETKLLRPFLAGFWVTSRRQKQAVHWGVTHSPPRSNSVSEAESGSDMINLAKYLVPGRKDHAMRRRA